MSPLPALAAALAATLILLPTEGAIATRIERATTAGIDVIVYPMGGVRDVVTLRGSLPAGEAHSPNNPVLATLAGRMLDQGTAQHDKYEIARMLESVGASISYRVGTQTLEVSARCLRQDIPLVIGLMAEQLRSPAFDAEEFAKVQKQYAGNLERALEDTNFRAADAFSRAVFPAGHPNRGLPPEELLTAVRQARLAEVKAFQARTFGPENFTLVVTGDVAAAEVQAEIARAFAGWQGGVATTTAPPAPSRAAASVENIFMADKTSVSVIAGQASGLKSNDADYEALQVATSILGSGFTGRLMANVRDKEGLTYGIGAGLEADTFNDGYWRITATFGPDLLDRGIASMRRQLMLWHTDGVTAAELSQRKTNLIGRFKVGLSTTAGMANAILEAVNRGHDVSWLDEYPAVVEALTLERVNQAIRQHLDPNTMVLIKAGTFATADTTEH